MSERSAARPARLIVASILLNTGRVSTYMLIGAAVGAIGATMLPASAPSDGLLIARWAGFVALSWVAFNLAGLVSLPRPLQRIGHPVYRALSDVRRRLGRAWGAQLFVAGLAWGFLPCAMVYGALFQAAFAGTWHGGALAMLGFGLGTSGPLVVAAMGIARLRNIAAVSRHPKALAAGLVAVGMLGLLVPVEAAPWLCLTR